MNVLSVLRTLWQRRRYEAELDEELAFHTEARRSELERSGMPPEEARRRARVDLGGWEIHKSSMRGARGLSWVDGVLLDLRYATRTMARSPLFTLVAVGSLALAIGANTNIFSVTNQLLYQRLHVPRAQDVRVLSAIGPSPSVIHSDWGNSTRRAGQAWYDSVPYPIFKELQTGSRSVQGIAGFKTLGQVSVTVNGEARPQSAQVVSGNFYGVLQAQVRLGRPILPSDEGASGTGFVAVVSDRYWKTVLGGREDVIGQAVRVNGNLVTIIGVNEPGFTGAESTTASPDLFLPISLVPRLRATLGSHADFISSPAVWWVNMVTRVRPDVSDAVVAKELSVLLERAVRSSQPVNAGDHIPHVEVDDGSHGLRFLDAERTPLEILLALTGLVLLLACVNIANLMLARTSARLQEMTVRLALGASRGRVLQQILTESLLISAAGGAIGFALGYLGRNLLLKLYVGRRYLSQPIDVQFDWKVFCLTATVTITTGLLSGILPAWRATRSNMSAGLKTTSRGVTRQRSAWTGRLLIGSQLALSTLLVTGAALFVRTMWNLNHVDPGFDTGHLLEFDINAPSERYPDAAARALLERIEQRVSALPGTDHVAFAQPALLSESRWNSGFFVEGRLRPIEGGSTSSHYAVVSPGFLRLMGIHLVRGRDLTEEDTATSAPVAVINESAVQQYFQGENPIGRRFKQGGAQSSKEAPVWYTVVGVCADSQYSDLREPRQPAYFTPVAQDKEVNGGTFVIRTALSTAEAVPMIRRAVAEIDGDIPLMNVRMLNEQIADSLRQERLIAALTAGFGFLALFLASIGIYGVMAYTVTQRTHEIGVRLALGARRLQVRMVVLREVVLLTSSGLLVGGFCVAVAMRLMQGVLYGTEANSHQGMLFGLHKGDPFSLLITAVVLFLATLLAGWLPAARASRVEPMVALRTD